MNWRVAHVEGGERRTRRDAHRGILCGIRGLMLLNLASSGPSNNRGLLLTAKS